MSRDPTEETRFLPRFADRTPQRNMNHLAYPPSIGVSPAPPALASARLRRTAIGRALIASAVIHALLIAFVPGFRNALPSLALPERLDVLLVARTAIEPTPPAPEPEPKIQPRPQPAPQPQVQRKVEPRERPVLRRVEPREPPMARPTESVEPAQRPPEQRIITAAPEAVSPGAAVAEPMRSVEPAPVPEVFKPLAPERPRPAVELPSDAMIAAYGSGFKAAVDKNRRYPRIAQARGWQGTATVLVKVLPGGRLGEVSVEKSSGFDLLDDTARDMVKTAQLPVMPEALRHHGFEMRLPVEFRLL